MREAGMSDENEWIVIVQDSGERVDIVTEALCTTVAQSLAAQRASVGISDATDLLNPI
jgi:hypothetical protein